MSTPLDKVIKQLQEEKDTFQRAKLIHYLHVERAISLKEISSYIHLHPTYISHYLRILKLPEIVLDGYYAKQVSAAHLFILSRLKNQDDILRAYQTILGKNLTSAQTEELIREVKFSITSIGKQLSPGQVDYLAERIKKTYPEISAKIIQTRVKGKIVLELSGDTEKTTAFIKDIVDKLSNREFTEEYDDMLQVLE